MRRRALLATTAATVTGLSGCLSLFGDYETRTVESTHDLPDEVPVDVSSFNGDVTVEPTDGDQVAVTGEIRARRTSVLDRVRVAVERGDGRFRVRPRVDGDRSAFDGLSVDLTVALPRRAVVDAETGNGDVRVDGVGRRVGADTGNGDVDVTDATGFVAASSGNGDVSATDVAGLLRATTGNGDVDADVRALPDSGATVSTGNGDAVARVPDALSAEVLLSTGNGDVRTDGVSLSDRSSRSNRVEGRLGDGGPRLTVRSGNGDVVLRALDG